MSTALKIPAEILSAATSLLRPYVPDLDEASLQRAVATCGINANPDHVEPMITVKEAAAYLAVSPRTVWRLIGQGRIRKVYLGRRTVRVSMTDIRKIQTGN